MASFFSSLAEKVELARFADDPVAFAALRLAFLCDAWQATFLSSRARQQILCCSRQSGKSSVTAVLAVFFALFRPGTILLVSPSLRQSKELFAKILHFIRALTPIQELLEDNKSSCTLENGSRIVSLPGDADTIRGYSAPVLVVIDEAAFTPDAVFASLRPMLAVSQGKMVLLSSPNGRRGFFFETWQNGGADWQRFSVSVYDCPRISKEWIEREKAQTPAHRWASEFENSFSETSDSLFSYDLIKSLFSADVKPLFSPAEYAALMGGAR